MQLCLLSGVEDRLHDKASFERKRACYQEVYSQGTVYPLVLQATAGYILSADSLIHKQNSASCRKE